MFSCCLAAPSLGQDDRTWNSNLPGLYDNLLFWDPQDVPDTFDENAIITTPDGLTAADVLAGSGVATVTFDLNDLTLLSNGANPVHRLGIRNLATFNVRGTISNDGLIEMLGGGNFARIRADTTDLDLQGSGLLRMAGSGTDQITAVTNGLKLTQGAAHTIEGSGSIGLNALEVLNLGTIDANVSGGNLVLDPASGAAGTVMFDNQGVVRASGGGTIVLSGNGGGEFGGTGVYEALAGSEILLTASAVVRDTTFNTADDGVVQTGTSLNLEVHNITNNGAFVVNNNTDLRVHGTINNGGAITLASTGNATDFELGADVMLQGGGVLSMPAVNSNVNAFGDFTLTNIDNQIAGAGNLGGNTARVVNQGQIDANVSGSALTIDPRGAGAGVVTFDNQGAARASGGGTLVLSGNGGGEFGGGLYQALAGSEVRLAGAAIVRNATFETAGDGTIETGQSENLELHDVANRGAFFVNNNTDLRVHGVVTNEGTISLATTGNRTDFELGADVTLQGGGTLQLNGPAAGIDAFGDFTLTNVDNQIRGEGNVGVNTARIVNQGLIDAQAGQLILDPRPAGAGVITFDNQHIAQASAGGTLTLSGNGGGEFGGGIYQALAGAEVRLSAAAIIRDATFKTVGDGVVTADPSQNFELHDVDLQGDLVVNNNTDLRVHGNIVNSGTITVASTGNLTDFELGDDVLLTGGGVLKVQGPAAGIDAVGDFTLTNVDNTIRGAGDLGRNSGRFVNQHVIDADVSGGAININPGNGGVGVPTFDNQGVARASNGGTLYLNGSAGGEFTGSGVYQAFASSTVLLHNAVVRDTTFETFGDGIVRTGLSQNVELHDVTTRGPLTVSNNTDLRVHGNIRNEGVITLASTGNPTDFELGANVTLDGGGEVIFRGGAPRVDSIDNFTLTNVDNRMHGVGNLGANAARVVNQAVIDANIDGGTLTLDPRNGGTGVPTFDNQGTAQASGGGILLLSGVGGGEFTGSGVYRALAGSQVQLNFAAVVRDATFDTVDDGVVQLAASQNFEFHDVENRGALVLNNNADLRLHGAINNSGVITIASSGNATDLELGADAVLTGGGDVVFAGPAPRLTTIDARATLTNQDNLITGAGPIHANLVNNGALRGTSATEFFEINGRLSGDGVLENVRIDNVHAPGNSTAVVPLEGIYTMTNTAELHFELGGTTPGGGHDQLSSTGTMTLDGDLIVKFVRNGFVPSPGDRFTIITADSPLNGAFDTEFLYREGGGLYLTWEPVDYSDPTQVTVEVATADYYAADFDEDNDVDIVDLNTWQAGYGITSTAVHGDGDADGERNVLGSDFLLWQQQLGFGSPISPAAQVPEPRGTLMCLAMLALLALLGWRQVLAVRVP